MYEVDEDAPVVELTLSLSLVKVGFPSPTNDLVDLQLDAQSYLDGRPATTYYARVSGDSIIHAGILDGDVIGVDHSLFPVKGKIVMVALNGEFTVKRIRYQKEKILLCLENDNYSCIQVEAYEDFDFYGIVTGIMRKFLLIHHQAIIRLLDATRH